MMEARTRTAQIATAGWIGVAGNAILSILKIVIGVWSSSFAVISDGIDSATDVLTSLITVLTIRFSSRPPDRDHPWGHARAETIATKVLSFVIFFAGAQLALSAGRKILFDLPDEVPSMWAIYVTLFSIVGKIALAVYKFRVGQMTRCAMLTADAKNMRNDVAISTSVLLGLAATVFLHQPLIDPLLALVISIWILKVALGIFFETTREIMDGTQNPEVYQQIFEAVESVEGASNPHRCRVRELAASLVIDLDVEVSGHLCLADAHQIAVRVEAAIKKRIPDVYDVLVHLEPEGNHESGECYGLSRNDFHRS